MSSEDAATHKQDWSSLPGRLIVVSGASGSGKSTLLRRALMSPGLTASLSVSATTRQPRPGEENGREYYFLSRSDFEHQIEREDLLEWAEVHGNLYGTPAGPVRAQLEAGRCVILEIDVQGALQVRDRVKGVTLIFINTPSFMILEERLRARSTENEESLNRRLKNARWEIDQASLYDHILINDDLERSVAEFVELVRRIGCGGN